MIARVTCLIAALAVVTTLTAAPQQSNWRRLDSPNFIVIGEVNERRLRDVAVKFEGFREVIGRVLNANVTSTIVPTVITVFGSDRTFTPFRPKFEGKRVEAAGLFAPGRDVNHILLVADDNPGRLSVIFHEYAHLLLGNTGMRIPLWLNEGLAEYYSTFQMGSNGRYAEIGHALRWHVDTAGGMTVLPISEMINATEDSPLYNEGNRRSVFYSKAWALTHFILQGDPTLSQKLASYASYFSQGSSSSAAWQRAFGAEDMDGDLLRYLRRGSFTATQYRFADKVAEVAAKPISVSAADSQAFQADAFVHLDQPADAAARLGQVASLDPNNALAAVVRGRLALEQKKFDEALLLQQTKASGDWYLDYLAAITISAAIESRNTPASSAEVQAVSRLLTAAVDRNLPNAVARLVGVEVNSANGPSRSSLAAIERARAQAPGRHDYRLLHARVLAGLSEFTAARNLLGPMMTPLYPEWVRTAARSLMVAIVSK